MIASEFDGSSAPRHPIRRPGFCGPRSPITNGLAPVLGARPLADAPGHRISRRIRKQSSNEAPPRTVEATARHGDVGTVRQVRAKRGPLRDPLRGRAWVARAGRQGSPSALRDLDALRLGNRPVTIGCHPVLPYGAVMATVTDLNQLLDQHVVLDLECLDRIYLNAYIPTLQT